jgi:thiol-disulfide isomerase/thioredoxin
LGVGLIDLAAYIVGLALALLLISWVGQRLVNRLEWATDPNGWFRRTLGVLFIVLAVMIASGFDKKIETDILNSGFFDVTKLEYGIRQALEGPRTGTPGTPGIPRAESQPPATGSELAPTERDQGPYIEIVKPAGFLNSSPFKLADLIGKKVILLDFIDYTCINCQRTFPYMNEWYAKYKDQGFEIVAIHTPEFSFEKDIKNVKMGADQFGIKFPIVLDNDYATWNAYNNDSWPHKFLINIKGEIVYDHVGEGAYEETEAEIVKLLNDRKNLTGEKDAVVMGTSSVPLVPNMAGSPETYFGAARNEFFGNGKAFTSEQSVFSLPQTLVPNMFYLGGSWKIDQEYAETSGSDSEVSHVFTAANMYVVAQTAEGSAVTAEVLIDGKPIPEAWRGSDVMGTGTMEISQSRLYRLYANPSAGRHRLDIIFSKPGVRIYTFTFG